MFCGLQYCTVHGQPVLDKTGTLGGVEAVVEHGRDRLLSRFCVAALLELAHAVPAVPADAGTVPKGPKVSDQGRHGQSLEELEAGVPL